MLLQRLNVNAPNELLNKAFGLSLSDQYWLKPANTNILYEDINFFSNDFDYSPFLEASLSKNSSSIFNEASLKTPNNTTDGMLRKAWIIENNTRYLLKGGYKNDALAPFNEALASEICKRLKFDHVPYTITIYKDLVVSKCPCFINENTEFIPCKDIMINLPKCQNIEDYENYIRILEQENIKDARLKLENMYILDFLIMNEDRHLNNFGVIRDVNTLKWLDIAPIFDSGQSLNILYSDEKEVYISGEGKFFYEIKAFSEIIKVVENIKRIDIDSLEDLPNWFDNLLKKYQHLTNYSDTYIHRLCTLLNRQINSLKKIIEKA